MRHCLRRVWALELVAKVEKLAADCPPPRHKRWGISFPENCRVFTLEPVVASNDTACRASIQHKHCEQEKTVAQPRESELDCVYSSQQSTRPAALDLLRHGSPNLRGPDGLGVPVPTTSGPLESICKILPEAAGV